MFGHNEITGRKFFREHPEARAGKLLVTSIFSTIQGEGPFAGVPAVFVRLAKCQLQCDFCFVPSTKIRMGDGTEKRIDQVKIGDKVMSWAGDHFEPRAVTRLYRSAAEVLVRVEVSNHVTWCTPEHPFLTSNRGWVPANNLTCGDTLVHWGVHDRMTLLNPARTHPHSPSPAARRAAALRMAALWDRPGYREKQCERMRAQNPMKDPEVAQRAYMSREDRGKTGLEKQVHAICESLPIYYCGNGNTFSIAHRMPDFKVRGQDKVIEVWASDALWSRSRGVKWMKKRRALFAKHGYQTLFLPINQNQLRLAERDKIREKVARFIHNGHEVRSVMRVEPGGHAWARLYGTRSAVGLVYNFEVEGTHTYVANDLVVHNCDTYFDSGDWLSFDDLLDRTAIARGNSELLVMTGGEPILQLENLGAFLDYVPGASSFARSQVETNGLLPVVLPRVIGASHRVTVVASPKAVRGEYQRLPGQSLDRADCLKFVISGDPSSSYHVIPDWALSWRGDTGREVFVSPMAEYSRPPEQARALYDARRAPGMVDRSAAERVSFWDPGLLDMEKCRRNYEHAAAYALEYGLRLTMQMQLFASMP